MPTFVWVIIGIVVLLILVAVAIYNGLVKLSTRPDPESSRGGQGLCQA